jgi:hypothetical protein
MEDEGKPDKSRGSGTSGARPRSGPAPESLAAPSVPCQSQLPVTRPVHQRVVTEEAVETLRSHADRESDRLNRQGRRQYTAWLLFAWVGGLSAIAAAATTALLPAPANRYTGAALALLASACAFATSMLPASKAAQSFEWAWDWHELDNDLGDFKGDFKGWPDADAWDEYQSFRGRARELYKREHAAMAEQDRARQAASASFRQSKLGARSQ